MKWTPDLIIALVLILGSIGLIASGIDGEVKSILIVAAGWAFGSQYQARKTKDNTPSSGGGGGHGGGPKPK